VRRNRVRSRRARPARTVAVAGRPAACHGPVGTIPAPGRRGSELHTVGAAGQPHEPDLPFQTPDRLWDGRGCPGHTSGAATAERSHQPPPQEGLGSGEGAPWRGPGGSAMRGKPAQAMAARGRAADKDGAGQRRAASAAATRSAKGGGNCTSPGPSRPQGVSTSRPPRDPAGVGNRRCGSARHPVRPRVTPDSKRAAIARDATGNPQGRGAQRSPRSEPEGSKVGPKRGTGNETRRFRLNTGPGAMGRPREQPAAKGAVRRAGAPRGLAAYG